ncbi:MAG: PhnA domain-containing protein [Bacteroidales bacterium]|jgi:protein PhnA|nr:PhnA domain-containing protein [Bacteroidales bacterium]
MKINNILLARAEEKCELCGSVDALVTYTVAPKSGADNDDVIVVCQHCNSQIENPETMDANHWRCLNDSMWNPTPAVQVMAWRMLSRLKSEGWPNDLLEMMYFDDETMEWAKATGEGEEVVEGPKHRDSNGVQILSGDTVVLIKDLNVKGTSMVAKRGTAVRNVHLVIDNAEHIEGRVNNQTIVILTKFVKKLV